jgi:hypothetical protein
MLEDTETPRVARLVARHRERSLPTESRLGFLGSATIDTPRPMCSRVTTADGRSPGSRVTTFRRLPETRESQWHDDERFAAYSCGGSRSFGQSLARTAFPINPLLGNRHPIGTLYTSQKASCVSKSTRDCRAAVLKRQRIRTCSINCLSDNRATPSAISSTNMIILLLW